MAQRLLIVTTDLYSGGLAEIVYRTTEQFSRFADLEVYVVIYDDVPVNFRLPEHVRIYRVGVPLSKNFGRTPAEIQRRAWTRFALLPLGVWRFWQLRQMIQPDLIVAHTPFLSFLCLLGKGSEKLVVVEHSLVEQEYAQRPFYKWAMLTGSRWLYGKADRLVAISQDFVRYFAESLGIPAEKIVYLPNFVYPEVLQTRCEEPLSFEEERLFREHPTILSVGRLRPQKGGWPLLRAFAQVRRAHPQAQLILLGDGEFKEPLKLLAHQLRIAEAVHFWGWQNNPLKYLARATVFANASLSEGFGLVILEAFAAGTPVVFSDCGAAPRAMLAPHLTPSMSVTAPEYAEYGILVPTPSGDLLAPQHPLTPAERSLAEALTRLLHEVPLREHYAQAGKVRLADFSAARIIPQWLDLFQQLRGA